MKSSLLTLAIFIHFTGYSSQLHQEPNECGIDIPFRHKQHTRLVQAIKKNFIELFISILEDQNTPQLNLINMFDLFEEKTLLMHACENGRLNMVEKLIKYNADINICNKKTNCDDARWPAILYAINNNHADVINFLLSQEHLSVDMIKDKVIDYIVSELPLKGVKSKSFIAKSNRIKNNLLPIVLESSNLLKDLCRIVVDYSKF